MPDTRKIIRNAYILSCDEEGTGGIGTVTIRNDRITSISYGRSRSDAPAPDVEVVDGTGKVLMPGFVDLHVHGESLLFDLLTAGEPHSRWQKMQEYVKAEAFWYQQATPEDWRRLYTVVCYQALRGGVTFLGEFGIPGGDTSCAAALEAFSRTELPGMLTIHDADQLERVAGGGSGRMMHSIALPPAEELTTYNLQASLRLSRESGYPLLMHMSDTDKDADILFRNFNKRPLQILEEFSILDAGCLMVHAHLQDQRDVQRLQQRSLVPILSPGAAVRKGVPLPPVHTYRDQNVRTAFCTDWGPFSHWAMLRGMMERDEDVKSQATSARRHLRDLTCVPASAIGLEQDIGTIAVGKRANLQLIRCRSLDLQAALDVLSPGEIAEAMVYRVHSSDVSDVMVNGEFSIREGTVLTYSEEDIVRDIQELLMLPQGVHPMDAGHGQMHPGGSVGSEEPEERAYRIVRRTEEDPPSATIIPLETGRDTKKDLPKTVRRVFGDDDI